MNKYTVKNKVYEVQIRIASIISEGIINRISKRDIMRAVKREILKLDFLSDINKNQLWLWSQRLYRNLISGRNRDADYIYSVLVNQEKDLIRVKNEIADELEYEKKHEDLVRVLKSDYKFYYCTVLSDPAADHAEYQGKIYYKDNANFNEAEINYIRDNNLLSVREVMLEKPWLCTRRNCRHRLIGVSFKNIDSINSVRKINNNVSYEETQYRYYKDRLKLLLGLNFESDKLKKDIIRTRRLKNKWHGMMLKK